MGRDREMSDRPAHAQRLRKCAHQAQTAWNPGAEDELVKGTVCATQELDLSGPAGRVMGVPGIGVKQ